MARTYEIAVELAGRISRSFNTSVLSAAGNLENLNNKASELETDRNRVTRFVGLKRELADTEKQFKEAQGEVAQLSREFEESKKPTRELGRQMRQAQSRVDDLAQQMRQAEKPSEALTQQYAHARENLSDLRKEYKGAERNTKAIERRFDKAKSKASGLNNSVDEQRKSLHELREEMRQAGQSTQNLSQQQADLARKMARVENRAGAYRKIIGADLPGAAGRFGREIGTLGRNATIAGGAVATATGFMVKGFSDAATETQTWSKRLGVSTEQLSRWQYVGEQFNIQNDAVIDGIKELSLRADEFATTGAGGGAEAFERLGLSQQQVADASGDTARLMGLVQEKIRGVQNVAARQRIADEIFGGQGGEQFTEMLSASNKELAEMEKRSDQLGYTLSDKAGKSSREFVRALNESQGALTGVRNLIAVSVIPVITDGLRDFSQYVADNRDQLEQWAGVLRENLAAAMPQVIDTAKGLASYLGTFAKMSASLADLVGGYDNLAVLVAGVFAGKAIVSAGAMAVSLAKIGSGVFTLVRSIPIVSGVMKTMAGAQWALNAAMAANPIGLIIAGIAALVAAGYLLYRNWDTIKEKAGEVWSYVTDSVGAVVESIREWFGGLDIVSPVSDAFAAAGDWLSNFSLAESGKKILQTLADGILSAKDEVIGSIKGVFGQVRDMLPFSDAKTGPLSQLTHNGRKIVETIGEGVSKAGSNSISGPLSRQFADAQKAAQRSPVNVQANVVPGRVPRIPVSADVSASSHGLSDSVAGTIGQGGTSTTSSKVINLTYSPQITVEGGGGSSGAVRSQVDAAVQQGHRSLLEQLREEYEDDERLSYA